MATTLNVMVNILDASIPYGDTGDDYITIDLVHDYLIWTKDGGAVVKDKMTAEPTAEELNANATIISDDAPTEVGLCLLMDYSHASGYYTRKVIGMGENKQYVYAFSFDGATASEPQLEAWDDSNHDSTDKHVLGGGGTPYDSFVKGVCTTLALPGTGWSGDAIAGASDVLLLNNGNGALDALATGETSQELYANLKIVIPQSYPTPSVETFVLTVRFSWN